MNSSGRKRWKQVAKRRPWLALIVEDYFLIPEEPLCGGGSTTPSALITTNDVTSSAFGFGDSALITNDVTNQDRHVRYEEPIPTAWIKTASTSTSKEEEVLVVERVGSSTPADDTADSTTSKKRTLEQAEEDNAADDDDAGNTKRSIKAKERRSEKKERWNANMNILRKYNASVGHTRVPKSYPVNPSFGRWVVGLKDKYRRIKAGITINSDLTTERIAELEAMGFEWKITQTPKVIKTFECRLIELRDFHSQTGNCRVPYHYAVNPSLSNWCQNLRYSYSCIQKGKTPLLRLTPERIRALDELGFDWCLGPTSCVVSKFNNFEAEYKKRAEEEQQQQHQSYDYNQSTDIHPPSYNQPGELQTYQYNHPVQGHQFYNQSAEEHHPQSYNQSEVLPTPNSNIGEYKSNA